jgi:hypothetical protein
LASSGGHGLSNPGREAGYPELMRRMRLACVAVEISGMRRIHAQSILIAKAFPYIFFVRNMSGWIFQTRTQKKCSAIVSLNFMMSSFGLEVRHPQDGRSLAASVVILHELQNAHLNIIISEQFDSARTRRQTAIWTGPGRKAAPGHSRLSVS